MIILGVILVGAAVAMPFFGMGYGQQNTAVTDALAKGDYQAYMTAIEQQWQTYKATLTQDKFNQMVSSYQSMSQKREQMQATQTAIKQAIKDGSYTEWQTAMSGLTKQPQWVSQINAGNFATYVQMVQARQSGNITETQTLATQLGIPARQGHGMGMRGMGWHKRGTEAAGGTTA